MSGGGYACVFDGTDDKVDVPYAAEFNVPPLTVMAWCRVDSGETPGYAGRGGIVTTREIYSSSGSFLAQGHNAYKAPDLFQYKRQISNGKGINSTWHILWGAPFVFGQWTHFAYTLEVTNDDGSQQYIRKQMYEDGSLTETAENVPFGVNTTHSLRIGCGTHSDPGDYGYFFFKGPIDDVRIYSSVLTETEIGDAMNEWAGP
jgi:hypothetical protein